MKPTASTPPNEDDTFAPVSQVQERSVLAGEISGVSTFILEVPAGQEADLTTDALCQGVYFLIRGNGHAESQGNSTKLESMTLYVARPGEAAAWRSDEHSILLKVLMELRDEEKGGLRPEVYPLVQPYGACEKYRDYFKSEKTTSRTLVHPFTLARFAMGSVETRGPDRIEPHAHPMLDQLFYSFEENDCTLLIDGESYRYRGNNLLHIPLGSDHGVDAAEEDVVHYLWIDFFEDEKEQQYLVEVHKPVKE